jgi:hypothetical protein
MPQLRVFYAYSEALQGELTPERMTSAEEPYNLINVVYLASWSNEWFFTIDLPMLMQFAAETGAFSSIGAVMLESVIVDVNIK